MNWEQQWEATDFHFWDVLAELFLRRRGRTYVSQPLHSWCLSTWQRPCNRLQRIAYRNAAPQLLSADKLIFGPNINSIMFLPLHNAGLYASARSCSSVQNKEEPPAHFKKCFCLFVTLQKVTVVLKTFENGIVENLFCSCCVRIWRQLLRRCKTISLSLFFNSQFHTKYLVSLTNQNARFHSIMRFCYKLKMRVG